MKIFFILTALIAFEVLAQYAPEAYVGPDQVGYYQTPVHLRGQNGQQRVIVDELGPYGERIAYPTDPNTGLRDYTQPGVRMMQNPESIFGDDGDTAHDNTAPVETVGETKKGPHSYSMRVWTSQSGKSVEALFQSVSNGAVILKKADSEMLQIPLAKLSDSDQKYVATLTKPNQIESPKTPSQYRGRRWTGTTHSAGKLKNLLAECGQPNVHISQKSIGPVEGGRNSQLLHCIIIPNGMGDYTYNIEENPDYPGAQDKKDFGHWYQNIIPNYPLK